MKLNNVPLSDKALLLQAADLLADDKLVWSDDLEVIRVPLSALLRTEASQNFGSVFARQIATRLMAEA